jgi:hypothetical protein
MHRFTTRIATIAIALLLAACGGNHNQNTAQLRVIDAIADAEPLDLTIDDAVKASAVSLDSTTSYTEVTSGTHATRLRSTTSGAILYDQSVGYNNGGNYTMALYGKRSAITVLQMSDDTSDPSSGKFKVRVADFALDSGALDFYVLSGDLASTPPTIAAAAAGGVTSFVEVAAGTYSFVLTASGTKEVVFQSTPQTLAAGAEVTFAAMPAPGGRLANAVVLTSAGGTFLANPLARIKAVNAMADAQAVTFKSDGSTLLVGVPFTASSSYVNTPSGNHTVTAELSNVPGTAIASLARSLDPARDYTVAATGTLASPSLVAFADDNTFPAAGNVKLRFANLRSDGGAVDVLVNFASSASAIAAPGVSAYSQVTGATNYTITFTTPGGVSVVASLDTGTLDAGGVYTVYLFGTVGSPTVRLVRDR